MLVDPSSLAPRYRSALFKLGVDVVRVSLREIRALGMISVGAVESVCNATVLRGCSLGGPAFCGSTVAELWRLLLLPVRVWAQRG